MRRVESSDDYSEKESGWEGEEYDSGKYRYGERTR